MEATYCANENCKKHTEQLGGKFRFLQGKWWCLDCSENLTVFNSGKNLWDFTTTHFNGESVHVRSGAHLDQLCKQYGVSNHARENYERHW
jgi:hypothetical protein